MATRSQIIKESEPRSFRLLSEEHIFEATGLLDPEDPEWCLVRFENANAYTTEGGVLEFFNVDDRNTWTPVAAFAPGYWGSIHVVVNDRPDPGTQFYDAKTEPVADEPPAATPEEDDEYLEALKAEGLSQDVAVQLAAAVSRAKARAADLAPAQASHQEIRNEVLVGLKAGEYPPETFGDLRPPAKLKDLWEGKGEATDDTSQDAENDAWWGGLDGPARQQFYDEQRVRDEALVERLRRESDATFEESRVQKSTSPFIGDTYPNSFDQPVEPWHGKAAVDTGL